MAIEDFTLFTIFIDIYTLHDGSDKLSGHIGIAVA